MWLGIGTGTAGVCECGDEPSDYMKCGEFQSWGTVSFLGRTVLRGVTINYEALQYGSIKSLPFPVLS